MGIRPFSRLLSSHNLGWNLGLSGHSGYARWLKDMGPLQSFYTANGATGVIDVATGMPTSDDNKLTIYGRGGEVYPDGGTYTITWTGTGTIGGSASPISVSIPAISVTRDCVGQITSLSVTVDGESVTQFTQTTLDRVSPAKCIRLLGPMRTNESSNTAGGGAAYDSANPYVRIRTVSGANTFYHQVPRPELIADLCEAVEADLWIPFHHLATNTNITDYIDDLVLAGFDRTLYIEHSNEVWSGAALSYPQHTYALTEADTAGVYTGDGGAGDARRRMAWHFDRSDEIAGVAKAAYANTIGVMGTSRATPNYIDQGEEANLVMNLVQSDLSNLDVVAIANYFGQNWANNTTSETINGMTNSDIASAIIANFESIDRPLITESKQYADALGKTLVGYEGGLSVIKSGAESTLLDFVQSTEAGPVYEHVLEAWKSDGCGLLNLYEDCGSPDEVFSHTHGELGELVARRQVFNDKVA